LRPLWRQATRCRLGSGVSSNAAFAAVGGIHAASQQRRPAARDLHHRSHGKRWENRIPGDHSCDL